MRTRVLKRLRWSKPQRHPAGYVLWIGYHGTKRVAELLRGHTKNEYSMSWTNRSGVLIAPLGMTHFESLKSAKKHLETQWRTSEFEAKEVHPAPAPTEIERKILQIRMDTGACSFLVEIGKDDTTDWWVTHDRCTGRGHTVVAAFDDMLKKLLK
jgi:hypothetical protein